MAATLTRDGEVAQTWFSIPIEKIEEDADGDLIVWGKATDGSVDSDEQIIDPDFSAKALQDWLDSAGNVRVQHQAMRDPAGKGISIEVTPDGHYVKSLVVEPVAQRLVKKGVLTAYSVGIARPTIVRDNVARGGRITDGQIVEISLVDRPANKNCGIQLVKAAKDGTPEWVEKVWGAEGILTKSERNDTVSIDLPSDVSVSFTPNDLAKVLRAQTGKGDETDVEKRDFDRNVGGGVDRDKIGSGDFAGRNRSFPVVTAGDVSDALESIGRAGSDNYDAATLRSNILRIARRKGFPVPDSAKKSKKSKKGKANKSVDNDLAIDERVMTHLEDAKDSLHQAYTEQVQDIANHKAEDDDEGEQKIAKGANASASDDDCDDKDEDDMDKAAKKKSLPPWLKDKDGDDDDDDDKSSASKSAFPPEIMASMRYKSVGAPHEMGMLHDFTCPAYDPDDVQKCHPHAGLSTLNEGYWQQKAIDMASSGSLEQAKNVSRIWAHAQTLKGSDQGDMYVLRFQLHKAFQDANPGPGHAPVPSGQIYPGSFNRPFISGGHSAASSGQEGPNSAKQPHDSLQPGQFTRGPLSTGHATNSPSYSDRGSGVTPPSRTGDLQSSSFGNVPRSNAIQAMTAMHDHISQSFPDLCPMKAPDIHANPVPTPGGTPSATTAKAEPEPEVEVAAKSIPQDSKPKKGKKLPRAHAAANMSGDESVDSEAVAEPDVEKAVATTLQKMLAEVPQVEQPAPMTQADIQASVREVLVEMLREEPVTQADVKKAVSAAVKKAVAAVKEATPEPASVPAEPQMSADDIRDIIKKSIADAQDKPEPVTPADLQKAISTAIEASRQSVPVIPAPAPVPVPEALTKADLKKAVSAAVKKAVATQAPPAPIYTPLVDPEPVQKQEEPVEPVTVNVQSPGLDTQALNDITAPLMARLEAQDQMLRQQSKALRKARQPQPMHQQPDFDAMMAKMQETAHQQAQTQAQLMSEGQAQQPGLTREDLAAFAQPLFQRMELQEKQIRKQEKRLEKAQMKAFLDQQRAATEPAPAPAPEVTREMIADLTRQLQEQPGVSEDVIKQVTAPLMQRLEAQERFIQERFTRDEDNAPVLAKLDAQEKMIRKQRKNDDEAIRAIADRLEAQPDIAKSAVVEATSPLLARLEAQEEMLRKQQKQLRKAQQQRESDNSIAALREQMLSASASQPKTPFLAKSAQLSELSVPVLERMKQLEKQNRKQAKLLNDAQEKLNSLADIQRTVDAMAGLPDPATAPFKGIANNIFKSQAPARPVGAQGVADVAERTQAMMLRELEEQFRTTSDPAQREAAWKTIVKMRGLPEGTNPF